MSVIVNPHRLHGTVDLAPSDAEVCRFLAAAAFSSRPCVIRCPSVGAEGVRMLQLLRALGAQISVWEGEIRVVPVWENVPDQPRLNFGASSLCLKLLLPAVCRLRSGVRFLGAEGEKHGAPLLTAVLAEHGCAFDGDAFPFYADGCPDDGIYAFDTLPDPDTLFGLALMLSLCPERGQVTCAEAFGDAHRSVMRVLDLFGARTEETLKGYFFPAGELTPCAEELSPRGDPMAAGLLLCAGAAGGPVTVCGADPSDPDLAFLLDAAQKGGAQVIADGSRISAYRKADFPLPEEFFDVPAACLPGLAVLYACRDAEGRWYGGRRRDAGFAASVRALDHAFAPLGVRLRESDGVCTVSGRLRPAGSVASSFPEPLAAALIAACYAPRATVFADLSPLERYNSRFTADVCALGGVLRGKR